METTSTPGTPPASSGSSSPAPALPSPESGGKSTPGSSTPSFEVKIDPNPNKDPNPKTPPTTADLFAQAKKNLGISTTDGEGKKDDSKTGQETTTEKKQNEQGDSGNGRKFKTVEEAEEAILALQAQVAELQKKPPKERTDTDPGRGDDDEGGQDGDDEEEIILDENELEALWKHDPKAARQYEAKIQEKKLKQLLDPISEALEEFRELRRVQEEAVALSELQKTLDSEYEAGIFAKTVPMLDDPKFLETLFKANPVLPRTLKAMVAAQDRVGTFELLIRETVKHNKAVVSRKQERSIPSESGISGGDSSPGKVKLNGKSETSDLWEEAKRKINSQKT